MSQSNTSGNPMVFQYKKRRYDGGTERDIIEHIERQLHLRHQHEGMGMPRPIISAVPMTHSTIAVGPPPLPAQNAAATNKSQSVPRPASLKAQLFQLGIMPMVELILGMSGMVVTTLMMVSHKPGQSPNPTLLQDRRKLMVQSRLAIKNSLKNIALAPYNLLRVCL